MKKVEWLHYILKNVKREIKFFTNLGKIQPINFPSLTAQLGSKIDV